MESVHNPDKFKHITVRVQPSQARGKERVRIILSAALELFREYGLEEVTTNDIAERAKIPIGSLYRYYPNKESILTAILDLVVDDISKTFDDVAKTPMLPYLSWDEVVTLLIEGWANYMRVNGSFSFLFVVWANPKLYSQSRDTRMKFMDAFGAVLKARSPSIQKRHIVICFNLSVAAVRMGVNEEDTQLGGPDLLEEAASAIAAYLASVYVPKGQEVRDILA